MELRYPLLTTILLILISGIYGALYLLKRRNKQIFFYSNIKILSSIQRRNFLKYLSMVFKVTNTILVSLIILCLIILTSRPIKRVTQTETKGGIDIVVVLDMSSSMFATDFSPNRIEASTKVISKFLDKLDGDRVGMVIFCGDTYTLAPLTFDYEIIKYYLNDLNPDTQWEYFTEQGTAMGDAIVSGTLKFQKDIDRSKVIILITDGLPTPDWGVSVEDAIAYANQNQVKIYPVYMGDPEADFKDSSYQGYYKAGDAERILKGISDGTGGKYYTVETNSALEEVVSDIQKLEKKDLEIDKNTLKADDPMSYITILSILFLLYILQKAFITKL